MYYPSDHKGLDAKIQAPFVLAAVRALRSSIFKSSPEVQRALTIADTVEQKYDLTNAKLYIPALETFCAILEPLSMTILTGTLRRVGYEMFPQYVVILGILPPAKPGSKEAIANSPEVAKTVKDAMGIKTGADLIRLICGAYAQCVVGSDAGALTPLVTDSSASVTDTTFMPCQLQMGVFLGAAKLTKLFIDSALMEKRCRAKGDSVCAYDFAL